MLVIKKLTYKNILSVGNSPIEIDFDNKLNTLVTGKNGHGKSLALSALVFSLYGKDFRGINKNGLINSINKKNLLTVCEFERNGSSYKVIRGIKPNIFEIYKNGVLLDQLASVKDQQKYFEEEILQFPYNTFKQIVVTGSGNYIPFMKLSAGQRREFIEDLLDLNVISLMQQRLKDKISSDREELKEVETQLRIIEEKITLSSLQAKQNSEKRLVDIELLKEQRNKAEELIETRNSNIKELEKKNSIAREKLKDIEDKISSMQAKKSDISDLKRKISALNNQIENISLLDSCPTCKQTVGEDHKHDINSTYSAEINSIETMISALLPEIEEYDSVMAVKNKLLSAIMEIEKRIGTAQGEKSSMFERIIAIDSAITNLSKETSGIELDLDNYINERIMVNGRLVDLKEKSAINDAFVLLLKDTGIKSVLINQYVDIMNELVNKYLEYFDFYVNFTIDDQFNEKIKSRHRDEFTYENFSEGEKVRIDLSLLFTFRELAKMKSNLDCNLIFFDEILDSAMDGDGLGNLYQIFELLEDTTIYVISHRLEASEMFDRTLVAEKNSNFTTLKILERNE